MLQQAMASFETSLKKFPDCAEGYALYGQALTDQQRFEEADKNFSSALKLEPDNGNFYVHKGSVSSVKQHSHLLGPGSTCSSTGIFKTHSMNKPSPHAH